jgi:N-methylhydantoinase A/oxoprolinase/acetone carboxylase beta subunit/N-methylhydantoinase B/oxoprolinase/acetone carboxylase alpha subunit
MFKVCIDIGGTFTDSVLIDNDGRISEYKVPTTPKDFSEGIMNTLKEAAVAYKQPLTEFMNKIDLIIHGTTIATNALVQRKVSRTALITTKGFRDIIEMRRALKIDTKSMYEAYIPPYDPLVPRYLRFVVEEETRYTGEIIKPLNENELEQIIERIKKEKVEAVAICFINSYTNPEHEIRAAKICQQKLPDVFVQYSTELLPTMGEYARESTCIISASVGHVVKKYLTDLQDKLKNAGFKGQLLIMQVNQMAQSVPELIKKPIYLLGSGPAAAPAGAAYLGNAIGEPNTVTADMGGTTLDAALVKNGEVVLTTGRWFDDDKVGIKVADVSSIGTGGGSIAWIDSLGLLRVGPLSAGADPGPACYNKGGTEPTVTDAAVILGYLPVDFFCGGKVPLNVELAKKAIDKIASRLNLSLEEAAQAIFTTSNSNMSDEITRITTKTGYDIREFSLIACGGGGAMCGAFWGDILNCKNVVVPNYASSFCAWSMFTLDVGRDYVRSYIHLLKAAKPDEINSLYKEMLQEALAELKIFNVSINDLNITKSADLRYRGQYHEVEISLPEKNITSNNLEQLANSFHKKHEELYTFSLPWIPVELRNLRLIVKIKGEKLKLIKIPQGSKDPAGAMKRTRKCYFQGKYIETPVYDSEKLEAGNIIKGPAIIEVPTTTAVVPPNFECTVDDYNNYVLTRRAEAKIKVGKQVQIDPITVATTWHFLQRVCRDMRDTMERTASNVLDTTLHDLAYGIWDARARVIAIPEGFPCRLISSTFPIKAVLKKYEGQIYPGDVFLTNHPFLAGAVHLADWVFIRPIFYKGELVFFSCMGTHAPDNGGAQAGTHFVAYDPIAEGLNIPPVKLVEKGQMNGDMLDLIMANNRLPDMMRREIVSLIGSTAVAERRLVELMDKYGRGTVLACLEEMMNRTEKAVRAQIAKWPEGVYFSEAQMERTDKNNVESDVPVTVKCKLTVKNNEATFDFSESDEQVSGNINAVHSVTMSDALCSVFLFLGMELSAYHNEGSLRPLHVITKEGTVVNCKPGSLTAATPVTTGTLVIDAVFSVMSLVLPKLAITAYGRAPGPGQKVGIDPRTNELYVYITFSYYGCAGAVYGYDGYQCACDMGALGVVSKTDVEEEMVRFPWRVMRYEFLTDSCGPGKWRGGPGVWWEGLNEGLDSTAIGGSAAGWRIPGKGQQGGYPTPLNRSYIRHGSELIEIKIPRGLHTIKTGDSAVVNSGGGAGVGLPEERDPQAVKMDVKNELVSIDKAKDIYKVVLDPVTLEIDKKATQELRDKK